MPYCVRFFETNAPECWLRDEFQVLFKNVYFKLVAMTECHVQLVHNALIGIRTLNLRITSTRDYPDEPLTMRNKPNWWFFFFYNSTTFGCSTTNLGSWVVGVIGNHTWKFQEFSKSITYNLGEKINCTETIENKNTQWNCTTILMLMMESSLSASPIGFIPGVTPNTL